MSVYRWDRVGQRRLSRRRLLNRAAVAGIGVAGLALVGCGGDDDDDADGAPPPAAQAAQAQQQAQAQVDQVRAGTIVMTEVTLNDIEATVVLQNTSNAPADFRGWFLCSNSAYWALPAITLAPGALLSVHASAGEDREGEIFASGGFGGLSGDGGGEIALYRSQNFSTAGDLVAYVGWNGGGNRRNLAQRAGLWGDADLIAAPGDRLCYLGSGSGADAFSVTAAEEASTEEASAEQAPPPSTPASANTVIVESITLDGREGVTVIRNDRPDTVSLDGWYLCQFPNYFRLPSRTLDPGQRLTVHASSGTDSGDEIFAGGTLGFFSGELGEMAVYTSGNFNSADAILSYISWNGARGRRDVARRAGIWGDSDIAAGDGDTIVFIGGPLGADAYRVR